ncbi:sodium:solute symporter family protein [Paraburkholderia phytofirmans]|uniref:Na+/solute symporter n=1 Tax=Paraburkholderia phytofirmans (strain DSM 17436 / LMG 22146 / PsJN) TaxID=398527 RepID=B2T5C5_PARPJ|nr:sodium:solute symporter [Paraburkholderia phytofirmans]ACD16786.1 Na+/solute symporter [Paraburkholderia phytofirmans PsJN]
MNVALVIIILFAAFALGIGLFARRGKKLSLEQWAVGGRGFGSLLTFLLMAGEAFSTFTFLGASGWTYSKGIPAFYILSYGCLAYVIGYWMLPAIWRYSKERNLVSFADYFASRYESRSIGVLVSIVAVFAMVSLLIIQLRGLGIIVSEMSYGTIPPAVAIWISAILMTVYMTVSGIHGSASIAVVKDVLILGLAIFLGLYLPLHYYGGIGAMFTRINEVHPELLRMPEHGFNLSWYNSTILLTSLGYYLYPHGFTAVYVARDAKALRRNVVMMPIYQVLIAFLFLVGFAAILTVHGLEGAQTDLALLRLVKQTFAPWFVGIVGGAGLLTALVPGSLIMLNASTTIARNIYREGFAPRATEQQVARVARIALPLFTLVVVYFTLVGGATFVTLAIFSSSLLTQLLPMLASSFLKRPFGTREAAFGGIVAGAIVLALVSWRGVTLASLFPGAPATLTSINPGLVALFANAVVFIAISAVQRAVRARMATSIEST